jgi:predicted transcriptional regulator
MLLNEFLKEHQKVETMQAAASAEQKQITSLSDELKTQAATHQREIATLTAALKEQAAQIQKVSAQMTLNKTPSQKVATTNN